ncbi:guanine nucleotide exchange factor Vps9 [Metarhizium album ARSEF 1941]|uniref:Guanine nucleotide exchange factor Vps9 n=1 Tax=Metarhizium album (strain ARSEF 1941) TaxID=1081103 RepID=A0A0B2X3G8_METAS|nr:guanine nucleotide exchange factor Vps9 [Metarhizium album ARSEF 1941]KHN99969.1 guanine nucleotide exchange factor Vps9 [Metarhizium album ARSEF 1941]
MSPLEEPTGQEVTCQPGGRDAAPVKENVESTQPSDSPTHSLVDPAGATDKQDDLENKEKQQAHASASGETGTEQDAASAQGLSESSNTAKDTKQPSAPILRKHIPAPLEIVEPDASDAMSSSVSTIKAPTSSSHKLENDAQYLTAEQSVYVDPTPATPTTSQPPSRSPSTTTARFYRSDNPSPARSDGADEEKRYTSEDEQDGGSRSEIQSIMEQFSEAGGGPGLDEVMSPRLEFASPILAGPSQHPPRKSSLEPLSQTISSPLQEFTALRVSSSSPSSVRSKERAFDDEAPPVPPKDGAFGTPPRTRENRRPSSIRSPTSPQLSMHRPPPPEPEPEPALPFDFHRFLEQLRNKKADPVARYLKSFLSEFGKKQWMVHEQVKITSDFLAFIANKMMLCDVWRDVSDAEFDNAREGMEKLVMNRLYAQTFSPAIAPPKPIPGAKPRRRGGDVPLGPGRRGQHQEDVERDEILAQKINIYGWVKLEHLDIPPVGDSGRRFLKLAQQELLKIKSYRAPRDKIICVLNCSKVIFGLLKHNKSDSSADSFMPLLIYVVLQSNPEHLVSNVQYILRFRNQEKLGGEAGYYLSSLMGAIQFIENMDRSSLTISDDEFERHVEAAVSAIAEKHQATSPVIQQQTTFHEKTGLRRSGSSGRPVADSSAEGSAPRRSTSSYEGEAQDGAAISGLLRTIQRPLSTIGRIFSDENGPSSSNPGSAPQSPGPPDRHPSRSNHRDEQVASQRQQHQLLPKHALSAEEAAARQASAEAAEAQRLHRAEHANVVETLAGMFPDLDKEIISDVVYQKQGR